MLGINVARLKIISSGPLELVLVPKIIESHIERTIVAIRENNTQYQYSLRSDRLLKSYIY
jgi:hypothetical protein